MQTWRKSSYSHEPRGNCVEVAPLGPVIGVRDSKAPDAAALAVPSEAWRRFTTITRQSLDVHDCA